MLALGLEPTVDSGTPRLQMTTGLLKSYLSWTIRKRSLSEDENGISELRLVMTCTGR